MEQEKLTGTLMIIVFLIVILAEFIFGYAPDEDD